MTLAGLVGIAAGCFMLSVLPATLGIPGYVGPSCHHRPAMRCSRPPQHRRDGGYRRTAGRRFGPAQPVAQSRARHRRIVMGAVFALASATTGHHSGEPRGVATGMRITFAVAALLIAGAARHRVGSRCPPRSARDGAGAGGCLGQERKSG